MTSQDEFMKKKAVISHIIPGGSGSGKKTNPLFFKKLKLKECKMTKFKLEIRPAVPIELRHKISELLEKEGHNVWAQGQFMNNSACDICFDIEDGLNMETDKKYVYDPQEGEE